MSVRGLEPGKGAALVISECQRGIVAPDLARAGLAEQVRERGMIGRIAALAAAFREAGAPVVYSTIVTRADKGGMDPACLLLGSVLKRGAVMEGTAGAEIVSEIVPQEGDYVVQRMHGVTPFHGTELEPILRSLGVRTVVLVGVSTNIALPGAAVEAVNRGFQVVIPEDCTAGAWPEAHEFQVQHTLPLLATVTTSADVAKALGASSHPLPEPDRA